MSELTEERERNVKELILNHRGMENAIPASQIAAQLQIKEGETYSITRSLIRAVVKKYGLPIAATTQGGYYFIETKEELFNYLGTLDSRIHETETRKRFVIENFVRYHGEIDIGEEEI